VISTISKKKKKKKKKGLQIQVCPNIFKFARIISDLPEFFSPPASYGYAYGTAANSWKNITFFIRHKFRVGVGYS